jgi:8-oxo-dGTP pyrophosphatase MutT (NUDIX family)
MPEINSIYIECYVARKFRGKYKFLLLKRSEGDNLYPGIWQIITGKIEKKEKAYETFYSPRTDAISLIPLFVCIVDDDNVILSDEHSEYRWLDVKKASCQLYFKSQKENVKFIESNLYSTERLRTFTEIKF